MRIESVELEPGMWGAIGSDTVCDDPRPSYRYQQALADRNALFAEVARLRDEVKRLRGERPRLVSQRDEAREKTTRLSTKLATLVRLHETDGRIDGRVHELWWYAARVELEGGQW